ncbi:error-prone DNA polymerase [Sphingobacterium oryzagri]|uniref:Error-prone DNA polymerase n=1 Tax=Sphingobacterium oryzagri TaxID=3025669 RepID=A0ABY7WC21_9SPHI|nr:error-prone DNA polymerase [Sphingobacterium sp. KACC 22765]WDF67203.1 error-prone DNA polymerase [Sphingobacterium sp. KACC 22765]
MGYIELQVTSNFSFLRGASHPEELMESAVALGYEALAITDRNSLAGIVRAHVAAKKQRIRLIVGCRLDFVDCSSLLVYPQDRAGYATLCALLSTGNLRAEKGSCLLYKHDLETHREGLIFIAVPPDVLRPDFTLPTAYVDDMHYYENLLAGQLYLGASRLYHGDDHKRLFRIEALANHLALPMVALGDVHCHDLARRELLDVLTCVREKCTIQQAGYLLHANAERYLKPVEEVERLFRNYPEALANSLAIADVCRFSLDELTYVYPEELTSEGRTPQEELEKLVWEGAKRQFEEGIPEGYEQQIKMELEFIARKNYPSYFLTVYDYVRFARSRGILCQGRGSAANSIVCYCLGITSVDPTKIKLLFARFMSDARDEPPDIDVDFEHERREEVIQYIYEKYGRDRAAIVATVTQERAKGALRDVGKAMGLSMDALGRLSQTIGSHWDNELDPARFAEHGFNLKDPHFRKILTLSEQLMGFPRQLGQHTGGFVITQGKMHELCPIIHARMENRTNIEWNKDDLEALGFLKVDVLGLGMLTCIRKAFDLVKTHYGVEMTLANVEQDDKQVYAMISLADTLGVFQIESRAQMSMLPRLRPEKFYDLVIEVAIVRPGPIQGDMVHPYLRRRSGEEAITYPSPEIESILERTKGVPLFQEQAMEIAIVGAGFTPAEADALRRSMATFKAKGEVSQFHKKMVDGMMARGYSEEFANRVFKQLEGFGSYGFPESHAASFALLVYVSSYIKCYYPDVFAAALLNSQPMGFYHPSQIVIDAEKHGVTVLAADINYSQWDNTLEGKFAEKFHKLRLGFRQVKGLQESDIQALIVHRSTGYTSMEAVAEIVAVAVLEKLADADAFRSIGLDRRQALWAVSAVKDRPIGMFKGQQPTSNADGQIALPFMTKSEHVVQDYASMGLSVKAHPVSFLREKLDKLHVVSASKLSIVKNGMPVKVCGLVTVRQRPGTAKGVLFVTIEDETGFANLVIWGKLFEKYRREILQSKLLLVTGVVQIEGSVIHVVVKQCFNKNAWLLDLEQADDSTTTRVFHKGRNFK